MFSKAVLVSGNSQERLASNVSFVANALMGTVESRTSDNGYTYGMCHYVDMNAGREVTLFFNVDALDIWAHLKQGSFYELHFELTPSRRGYDFALVDFRELTI